MSKAWKLPENCQLTPCGAKYLVLQCPDIKINLETLQTVAYDMYVAGRFIDPSIDDPNWPVEKNHTVMYKQYSAKDECYYIIVRFLYEGIPLYDSRVGLSDGTNIYTMEKRDGANSPFTISGPICHLLLDQNGFTYARIDSGVCLNFQTVEKPKPILTFQEAQKALASLYVDQVIPKPNSGVVVSVSIFLMGLMLGIDTLAFSTGWGGVLKGIAGRSIIPTRILSLYSPLAACGLALLLSSLIFFFLGLLFFLCNLPAPPVVGTLAVGSFCVLDFFCLFFLRDASWLLHLSPVS